MKYYIGKPQDVITNHKTYPTLSQALYATNAQPSYDDMMLYTYDDQGDLTQAKQIGGLKFLETRAWFFTELHRLEKSYGTAWGIRGMSDKHQRSFPKLESELKEKLL